MPWVTIIMMILSYFTSKKTGASGTRAAITAGLVGAGTYYVTHNTDWGQANLGQFDGVATTGSQALMDPETGLPVQDVNGKVVNYGTPQPGTSGTNFNDVLKTWGGTGTAAVIGAGTVGLGVATGKINWLVVGGIALAAFAIFSH